MAIPAQAPSTATRPIRVVWREVAERWGNRVSSAGVTVCRRIAGSTTWSQHAWGNGWDITGPTWVLNLVAAFLRSKAMRPYVAQVLWQVPDHYDHIHVSGRPMFTGTPPCAGGEVITPEQEHRLIVAPVPRVGELVASETWAPAARAAVRELERRADRIGRIPGVLERILSRG